MSNPGRKNALCKIIDLEQYRNIEIATFYVLREREREREILYMFELNIIVVVKRPCGCIS